MRIYAQEDPAQNAEPAKLFARLSNKTGITAEACARPAVEATVQIRKPCHQRPWFELERPNLTELIQMFCSGEQVSC